MFAPDTQLVFTFGCTVLGVDGSASTFRGQLFREYKTSKNHRMLYVNGLSGLGTSNTRGCGLVPEPVTDLSEGPCGRGSWPRRSRAAPLTPWVTAGPPNLSLT